MKQGSFDCLALLRTLPNTMSEVQQPVQDAPAAVQATTEPTVAPTTATKATTDPVANHETTAESIPAAGLTDSTTAAEPTDEKLGKGDVAVTAAPISEGVLNYKGTGLK